MRPYTLKNLFLNNAIPNWTYLSAQPEFIALQNCLQDPIHHAEGDVFLHTQMVCDKLAQLPQFQALNPIEQQDLMGAALFHDIEKPSCTKIENGRVAAPKHALKGEMQTRFLLWNEDFYRRERICAWVRWHGLPLWLMERPFPEKMAIAFAFRAQNAHLYLLAKADILGRICQDQQELLERIELFKLFCQEIGVWKNEMIFHNDHSRFKFFRQSESNYPAPIFENTQFEMTLMCGVAGSGKDTFIQQNIDVPVLSLDDLRTQFKVKYGDKLGQGRVIQAAYERGKEYARKKQSFVWNAMNLSASLRHKIIDTFAVYQPSFKVIYVEANQEEIYARRKDAIPITELHKMMRGLEIPQKTEVHEIAISVLR